MRIEWNKQQILILITIKSFGKKSAIAEIGLCELLWVVAVGCYHISKKKKKSGEDVCMVKNSP